MQNGAAVAQPAPGSDSGIGNMEDPDERSIFVKNVDFSADDQSLIDHFKECGEI